MGDVDLQAGLSRCIASRVRTQLIRRGQTTASESDRLEIDSNSTEQTGPAPLTLLMYGPAIYMDIMLAKSSVGPDYWKHSSKPE